MRITINIVNAIITTSLLVFKHYFQINLAGAMNISLKPIPYICILFQLNFYFANISAIKLSTNPEEIKLFLFSDRRNPYNYKEIRLNDLHSLQQSGFIPNIYTVIQTHGFIENAFNNRSSNLLIAAYLKSGLSGNFLVLDWSKLSDPRNTNLTTLIITYPQAAANIKVAGRRLADYLIWLDKEGVITPSLVHLTGVSLGAHVSGLASHTFCCRKRGVKVGRISGFDPALPLTTPPIQLTHTLTSQDADFVDIIHSNPGIYGELITPGDVDIFVNGIIIQPICEFSQGINEFIGCSHGFALRVYAFSLLMPVIACRCPNLIFAKCSSSPCMNPTLVGYPLSSLTRGIYHVDISGNIPRYTSDIYGF